MSEGSVTITTESSTNGATTLSRINYSGFIRQVTTLGWIISTACCLVVELSLVLELGWC